MKKIFGLILLCFIFLVGCNSKDNTDGVTKVTNYLSSLDSYSLSSTMKIKRTDKEISLDVDVDYLAPNYYKVEFNGESQQLILKNDSGVFVISKQLNKEFKFDNNWPMNGSHPYLLETINKDIKADSEASCYLDGENFVVECKIEHKTNQSLNKLKYTCTKDFVPVSTKFINSEGKTIITVEFTSFLQDSNLSKDNFNQKNYLNKQEEGNEEESSLDVTTGFIIDGSSLTSSVEKEDTVILCYSGDTNYTIIVNKVYVTDEVVAIDDYDDIEYLESGLGLLSENSMRFYINNYEITIYSNSLTVSDYITIAESITLA